MSIGFVDTRTGWTMKEKENKINIRGINNEIDDKIIFKVRKILYECKSS